MEYSHRMDLASLNDFKSYTQGLKSIIPSYTQQITRGRQQRPAIVAELGNIDFKCCK